jgi:hypothetical protein
MTDDDDQPRREAWTRGKSGDGEPVADADVPMLARAMAAMSKALILFCEQEKIRLHDVVIGMRSDDDSGEANALCGFIDGHEARGLPAIDVAPSPVLDALLYHLRECGEAEGVGIGVVDATDMIQGNDAEAMN